MDKLAVFGSAVSGNTSVLPGINSLPLIRNSNADQIAFSRFGRHLSPSGYGRARSNFSRLLSHTDSGACDGFFYAADGSAARHNGNLLPRYDIGLLRFGSRG